MTDEEWRERLEQIVAQVNRKREAQRAQRTELSRRRWYGLRARHAAKLARNRHTRDAP
jgi:hypothetical protein